MQLLRFELMAARFLLPLGCLSSVHVVLSARGAFLLTFFAKEL